jgi:hypothetical protein
MPRTRPLPLRPTPSRPRTPEPRVRPGGATTTHVAFPARFRPPRPGLPAPDIRPRVVSGAASCPRPQRPASRPGCTGQGPVPPSARSTRPRPVRQPSSAARSDPYPLVPRCAPTSNPGHPRPGAAHRTRVVAVVARRPAIVRPARCASGPFPSALVSPTQRFGKPVDPMPKVSLDKDTPKVPTGTLVLVLVMCLALFTVLITTMHSRDDRRGAPQHCPVRPTATHTPHKASPSPAPCPTRTAAPRPAHPATQTAHHPGSLPTKTHRPVQKMPGAPKAAPPAPKKPAAPRPAAPKAPAPAAPPRIR